MADRTGIEWTRSPDGTPGARAPLAGIRSIRGRRARGPARFLPTRIKGSRTRRAPTAARPAPRPRLFLDSFVSSTSCRGPGSLKRLRAKRGLPGSNAILPCVMWPQTPAGQRFLA
jgi:hypothetical protein